MPAPTKPPHVRLISGSRHRPHHATQAPTMAIEPLAEVPAAPDWITTNPHAVDEWNRIAPALVERGILAEVHLSLLGIMCYLIGNHIEDSLAERTPKASLIATYIKIARQFGITPATASMPPFGAPRAANKFAARGKPPPHD